MDKETLVCGAPLGPRPVMVHPETGYKLLLDFDNGEKRIYDMSHILHLPIFQPLKNIELFNQASIVFDTVGWPGDIDICPDELYENSILVA